MLLELEQHNTEAMVPTTTEAMVPTTTLREI